MSLEFSWNNVRYVLLESVYRFFLMDLLVFNLRPHERNTLQASKFDLGLAFYCIYFFPFWEVSNPRAISDKLGLRSGVLFTSFFRRARMTSRAIRGMHGICLSVDDRSEGVTDSAKKHI